MAGHPHRLVGREAERAAITRLLAPPHDSFRGLLLEGEAGIGKTCLWRSAHPRAHLEGYRLLVSAPTKSEAALPYAVLADLLDPPPEQAIALLPPLLRSALEVALFRARDEERPTDQLAVCTALLRVLRSLAADQPLLVALDDLQWVDEPSRRALDFAVRRLDQASVRVLATARVAYQGGTGVDRDVQLPAGFETLSIGPLPFDAMDRLLLDRLERPLRRPELERVYSISGGNPFFALEIGRFVIERGSNVMAPEPLALPRSLTDAIQARVAKLPPGTRDILVAAAAMSQPSEAALRRIQPGATAMLEAALAAEILERQNGRLRFTHPLLASVVYTMADGSTRRRWHGRLARIAGDAEQRAHHVALSADGPDVTVAAALEEAARSANRRGAPGAASTFAEQAAQLTPSELTEEIQGRRIAAAGYRLLSGDLPGARGALEDLIRSSPADAQPAEAFRLLGNIAFSEGDLVEAERLLMQAILRTPKDARAGAIIERDLIRVLSQRGDLAAAVAHSRRMAEIAERSGDSELAALALRLRAVAERHHGRALPREAREMAIALAEGRTSIPDDDTPGVLHPLLDWANLLKWSDDFDRARILFKRILTLTEGRDESVRAPVLFHLAEMECWAGDLDLAAVYAEECEKAVLHTGQQGYRRLSLVAMALLHCLRGDLDQAREEAEAALVIARQVGDNPYRRRALAILGAAGLAEGDPGTANGYFEELRDRIVWAAGTNAGVVRSEGDEVETLLALGRREQAEGVVARVAAEERELGDPWPRAVGARCRGLLAAARGDLARSEREFESALVEHEDLPMPFERARTLFAYAALLRRRRRKRAAREALEQALGIFDRMGARVWAKRAELELSRVSPRPVGADRLTPTEARVAELVARGRRNREVADELFLSVKTVEAHLSRVYDKMRVRSRSELAAKIASER